MNIINQDSKSSVFSEVSGFLEKLELRAIKKDSERPWGGFFVIDESQTEMFANIFFPELEFSQISISQKLSPKILIVAPYKRLSWQYHFRRAEIWKVIGTNSVGVKKSSSDWEPETIEYFSTNQLIKLNKGERHRLIGADNWGIVAEIWQHTDSTYPSDENDIVRLQDDFGR